MRACPDKIFRYRDHTYINLYSVKQNFKSSFFLQLYNIVFSVSAQVPQLGVYMINESPQITNSTVRAEFQITRPVVGVRCFLRSQYDRIWQDCKLMYLPM